MTFPRGLRQRGFHPTPLLILEGIPMSTNLFSADLATVSADVRAIREGLLVAQVDAIWEEATDSEAAELTVRAIAADRSGDWAALHAITARAREIDAANPFGPRLVDQLTELVDYPAAA